MSLKERIIEETTRLFALEGVKSVRMDDIAANLCISKKTLYEHFSNKEDLILECIRHYHSVAERQHEKALEGAKNIVEEFIIAVNMWDENIETGYRIMSSVKKFYPKVHQKFVEEHSPVAIGKLKKKIESGVREGFFLSYVNIDFAISVYSYSMFSLMQNEPILPTGFTERDAFKYLMMFFFRGMATQKAIGIIDEYFEKQMK